ncbi:MAG: hypothetical protein GKR89_31795 [Candidatus Latescibacteria bacterium]|nr:hypothetical protein [Candidatus Latescibacterota bacterium]
MPPIPTPAALDHAKLAQELLILQPVLWDKITTSTHLERREVPQLLTEVLRFLHLIASSKQRLTPARPIDLAWHEFILCTRTYGPFCQRYWGTMIHHQPGGSQQENNNQFAQTLALYRLHFGPPPSQYWLPDAHCGSCQSPPA